MDKILGDIDILVDITIIILERSLVAFNNLVRIIMAFILASFLEPVLAFNLAFILEPVLTLVLAFILAFDMCLDIIVAEDIISIIIVDKSFLLLASNTIIAGIAFVAFVELVIIILQLLRQLLAFLASFLAFLASFLEPFLAFVVHKPLIMQRFLQFMRLL